MQPLRIQVKDNKYLQINWSDNSIGIVKLSNLRRNCPCAFCFAEREKESSSYIPIYSNDQLKVKNIQIIGTYALGIYWGDDHNTGIYDFIFLKKLSEQGAQS